MLRRLFLSLAILLVAGLAFAQDVNWPGVGRSAGGARVPGLSSGVCDDRCVEYLYNLKTFEALPDWPTIYLSEDATGLLPVGNDANAGTREAPLLTLEAAELFLQRSKFIVALDSDTFDGAGMAGFNGIEVTDVEECDPDEPCVYFVGMNPDVPTTISCAGIPSTVLDGLSVPVGGSPGNQPFALVGNSRVGMANMIWLNCPEEPDRGGGGVFDFGAALTSRGPGDQLTAVNVLVNNFAGEHMHPFRTNGNGDLVLLNIGAKGRNMHDFDSDCVGPTCHTALCTAVNTPFDCCTQDGANFRCGGSYHMLEFNGHLTAISKRSLDINNGNVINATGPACAVQDGGGDATGIEVAGVLVGLTCASPPAVAYRPTPGGDSEISSLGAVEPGGIRMFLGRVRVMPRPVSWNTGTAGQDIASLNQFNTSVGTTAVRWDVFQSTFTGSPTGFRIFGQFANHTINFESQCSIWETIDLTGADAYIGYFGAGNVGTINIDIDGTNVYDADDGVSVFNCGADFGNAQAVTRTGCVAGITLNADFFGSTFAAGGTNPANEGPGESGGLTVNGNVFSNGTEIYTAQAACSPGEECEGLCSITKIVQLPSQARISATVVGEEIRTLRLGTHYTNAGAY